MMVRKLPPVVLAVVLLACCVSPLFATIQSSANIALVPDAWGRYGGAGVLPTYFAGMAFWNLDVAQVNAANLANFDTVVLYQVGDASTVFGDQQKADINDWVYYGGKLIIYDSDACPSVDYTWLAYPFTTNNPGQLGSNAGTLTIVEENELSSNDPASPYYVDAAWLSVNTDAIGDANVMTSHDPNWYGDMQATNANGVTGWCHTYAEYGHGLILYNGIDTDYIGWGDNGWLEEIWYLELAKYWDPSDLPGTHPVTPVYWKGFLGSSDELRFWTQMTELARLGVKKGGAVPEGEVVPMSWWTGVVDFLLKIWSAVSRGWDALFAEAGKAVLTGYKFSTLADQGVTALKVERGDEDADPTVLQSFQKVDVALLALPAGEVQEYLDDIAFYGGPEMTYDEWRALGPRLRLTHLLESLEFRVSPTGHSFILQNAADMVLMGIDVVY